MPFYEDRTRRPRRKDSIGPEEGYRPRSERKTTGKGKPGVKTDRPPQERGTQGRAQGQRSYQERSGQDRGAQGDRPYQDRPPQQRGQGKRPYQDRPPQDRMPAQRPPRPARPERPMPIAPVYAPVTFEEDMPRENLLAGRNPIREAIKSGRDIERLLVARGELSGSAREIVAMAKERHIVVQTVDRARLDEITQNHQGMIAFASAFRYGTVEDMFALAKERGQDPLLVILDGVTDPHNLGAIIRSAECAGAHGVIVPERRAVGLTPAAVKASAGAVEYVPVARATNLTRLLTELKEAGVWIAAAVMDGELYTKADLKGPLALVIGGEGSGVSRLVLENADYRVALPMAGKIDSLNASVAAGVLLYEIRRQRG